MAVVGGDIDIIFLSMVNLLGTEGTVVASLKRLPEMRLFNADLLMVSPELGGEFCGKISLVNADILLL